MTKQLFRFKALIFNTWLRTI